MKNTKYTVGVSIVELAIVIIIIGVLVMSLVAANSVVESAKIRKVIHEIRSLAGSYRTFEITYDAVPGDILDAYEYFGTRCASAASLCDGDGNGQVEGFDVNSATAGENSDLEYLRLFQHLRLAGLYEGDFSGTGVEASNNFTECSGSDILSTTCIRAPGYNVPKTTISTQGYYTIQYEPSSGYQSNVIYLGGTTTGYYTADNTRAVLTVPDAHNIDQKLDDGNYDSGRVRFNTGGEKENKCIKSGAHVLTNTGVNCFLLYLIR